MVDLSGRGIGYAFLVGHPSQGYMVGMKSHAMKEDRSSSLLGELKALCWALKGTKQLIQGNMFFPWTDNCSQKITQTQKISGVKEYQKKMEDIRVSRLLAWLWQNFPTNQLIVKFVPCGQWNCWCIVSMGSEEEFANGKR